MLDETLECVSNIIDGTIRLHIQQHVFSIIFILNLLGPVCGQETVAPLARQPRPSSASGTSHVHPHISNQDQFPQHQTDHSCVSMGADT